MESRFGKFTGLLIGISRGIQKIKNVEMEKLGLKGKQAVALFQLYCSGGLTASELCMACDEDKAATSRVVKELEEAGFVFVEVGGQKKYRNKIKLTQKGETLAKIVAEKIESMVEFAGLGVKDREKLYEMLEQILTNIQKICSQDDGELGGKND